MAACYVIFSLLLLPVVHKIIMPLIIVISAAISYNTLFFNVYFNRDMLDNVLQTTLPETARMMSVSYIMWLLMLGVLPALAYILTRVQYRIWWREILQRLTGIAVALLVVVGVAAVFYQDYASFSANTITSNTSFYPAILLMQESVKSNDYVWLIYRIKL